MKAWFDCSCLDPNHAIRLLYYEEDKFLYLEIRNSPAPFWARLKMAFKVLCGVNVGDWEVSILTAPKIDDLANFLRTCYDHAVKDGT